MKPTQAEDTSFKEWPSIPRLSRECTITEKIDGTNASLLFTEDGQFFAGSRTRWLSEGQDNFGFYAWANKNKEALRELLGVGRHYGEWWGLGIQIAYAKQNRCFSLFNVKKHAAINTVIDGVEIAPVPTLYIGEFTTQAVEDAMAKLKETGSVASKGFMRPEGVVVFHHPQGYLFKKTFENDEKGKSYGA
jgi:hypothetical protein